MGSFINRNASLSVGTTNVVFSEERFTDVRKLFSIINTSTGGQKISISFGSEAVSGQGVVISPGGFYSESADGANDPTQSQICVVSDLAGATIAVSERILIR